MKFRKNPRASHITQVEINREWYNLGLCLNCEQITALHNNIECVTSGVDKKIKCCKSSNIGFWTINSDEIIEAFVKRWGL